MTALGASGNLVNLRRSRGTSGQVGVQMNFFFNKTVPARSGTSGETVTKQATTSDVDGIYQELVMQRPALLDEKVKLHERIIDEYNLASLEKLPRDDLVREVSSYLSEYVR